MTKHFANCKMLYNNDFCRLLKRLFDNDTESAASHKDTHYRGIESLSLPFSVPWSIWGRSSHRNSLFTLAVGKCGNLLQGQVLPCAHVSTTTAFCSASSPLSPWSFHHLFPKPYQKLAKRTRQKRGIKRHWG